MIWKLVLDLALLFHRPNSGLHVLYRSFAMNLSHVLAGTCYFFSVFAVWQNSPLTLLSLPQLHNFYLVFTFDTWCFPLVLSTRCLPLVLSTWFLPLVLGSISCLLVDMIRGAGKPFVDTFHEVVFFSQIKGRRDFSKSKSNREKKERKGRCP